MLRHARLNTTEIFTPVNIQKLIEVHRLSHPEADEELVGAALWYEERQPGLGDDFLDEFEHALHRSPRPIRRSPRRSVFGVLALLALKNRSTACVSWSSDR